MLQPSSDGPLAGDADHAACRAMIQAGSKSFAAASLLLPYRVRAAAYALYALCRLSDDLIDIDGGEMDAIARLRTRLANAYARQPDDSPIDRAFSDVVTAYRIPQALPSALIEGLEWDVRGHACETASDVFAYAARVAGSVGVMMATLMGVRDSERLARACDLGVAMQLTNIARDVGEDARNGRLYLPRAWLREEGIEPDAWLAHPVMDPRIGAVVRRVLDLADDFYVKADAGIARLPLRCRPGILAARNIYHAIGADVARRGFDSVSRRARVSGARKLVLGLKAIGQAVAPRRIMSGGAPLIEVAFLVKAAAEGSHEVLTPGKLRVSDRILWVAELFANLEMRQRVL